jgi:hypothetical protein
MPDWKTRLAVSVKAGNDPSVPVIPIDSYTPTFTLNAEPLHSLEATHIGVVYSPQSMTFTMTVKAIGGATGTLTSFALQGRRFNIILQEQDNTGDDWTFHSVVMTDCVITSASPTSAAVTGAPSATFSGFSLSSTATYKDNTHDSIPRPTP